MAVKLQSGQVIGLEGILIDVEVDLAPGLHRFSLVGLPDKAVEESKERISSAIKNSGFRPPHKKNQRVTISLAPADLKKEGPLFDLPIALGYLLASKQAKFASENKMFVGELALDGTIRKANGVLPISLIAKKMNIEELFVPRGNGKEAALVKGVKIFEISSLNELLGHLCEESKLEQCPQTIFKSETKSIDYGFEDIKGQESAKRGAEIAAAGMHHIAMIGPPGAGKTLIARALPSILPPLSFSEALEVTTIHSVAGTYSENLASDGLIKSRPFRAPHHTASYASLIGGGTHPKPGEITLAHRGVLFMDEFPEFERRVIESMREPLEDGIVSVSRVKASLIFPAKILLAAALNPCPCGNRGTEKECTCLPQNIARYERKISGPIIDRIDLWLSVPQVEHEKLEQDTKSETSAAIRARTTAAYNIQNNRFKNSGLNSNSEIGVRDIKKYCPLSNSCKTLLQNAARNLDLSARSYHRIIKIGRTISDLNKSEEIKEAHLAEALQYRYKTI
ncbi:YifB family Mg chelatase-like AAA ATPase [Patescibacteria group bacterium]